MKRLLRFLVLFGAGLLALVLALGPGRLFRRTVEPTIAATDLREVRTPIQVPDPGQKGRSIGVALEGAGRIPIWKDSLEPDGSTLRVKAALLEYEAIEPFAGGLHFSRPSILLYPGRGTDERPSARIRAGGADLATQGGAGQAQQFSQGFRMDEVREFTLSPAAVLEQLDLEGNVELTLETDRLESPEAPADESGEANALAHLVAPGPVHLWRADHTFDLRAGGMELDATAGTLTLAPPIAIHGSASSLPGRGAPAAASSRPREPAPAAPFALTADGVATFERRGGSSRAQPAGAETAAGAHALERVLGPGQLVFTKNVLVKKAAASEADPWLRAERVVVELEEDEHGQLLVKSLDAGVPEAPLALGLLGGEGHATTLRWDAPTRELTLAGPVEITDVVFGEGTDERRLALAARGRLVARRIAASGPTPELLEVELLEEASARIAGELVAHAERLVATLLPASGGGAATAKLVSVELFGGEHPATADLGSRGRARAQRIQLVDDGSGGRVAHLEGDARAEVAHGFVAGERIDVVAPGDPALPTRLIVPELAGGEIELPGPGPFDAAPREGGDRAAVEAAEPRKVVLEPLGPCRLERVGDGIDLVGRCRYRVRSAAPPAAGDSAASEPPLEPADLQRLECDELHLIPRDAGRFDAHAAGAVVLDDPERGAHATAASARTEQDDAGVPRLVLEGAPARVVLALARKADDGGTSGTADVPPAHGAIVVQAARIERDLASGAVRAEDPREQVLVLVPESLVGDLLPRPGSSGLATRLADPARDESAQSELRADRLAVSFAPGTDPLAALKLDASGRVSLLRPPASDPAAPRGSLRCGSLVVDRSRGYARLDGETGTEPGRPRAPVKLEQPLWYAPERVESVEADWIVVRDGGREMDVAPRSVFVFHPERAPAPHRIPRLVRVELHASNAPELRGRRLLFGGGVEFLVTLGEGERQEQGHVRSERVELLLDRALDEVGAETDAGGSVARGVKPVRLNATQRVHLDYGRLHAEGNLLTFDFTAGETGSLKLKEGVQPCTFLAQDEAGDWHVTSQFEELEIPPQSEDPARSTTIEERIRIKGLELVVEGPRER